MPDFSIPEELEAKDKNVGRRLRRIEDQSLLRGEGRYVDDIAIKKNTLHAAFLRSPHAHAEVVSIDYSEALKIPGVIAVVTGEDMLLETKPLQVGFKAPQEYYGIATDKVRYVGEPVVVVAATDRYLAEDALEKIKVEYKILPAAVDTMEAIAPDAPKLHPKAESNCVSKRHFIHGDPDQAFKDADHTTSIRIKYPRNSITPMENYAIVAEYVKETEGFDVLSNFQGPFSVTTILAIALKIRSSSLRLRSPNDSGGSFGSKLVIFPYIMVLCVLSRKARRPIKWIEDRLEHLSAASVAPNRVTDVEAAYNNNGSVVGLRLTHFDDHGAYLRAPMPAPIYRMHGISTNGYTIRNLEVTNHIIATNKCPTGAVRGFGAPQLYFGVERIMHKISCELGMDHLDLIKKNLVQADQFPYRTIAGAVLDSGNYQLTIKEACDEGGLEALKIRREEARKAGKLYGIGYAGCVEPSQSNMGYISTLKTAEERKNAGPKDGAVASVTVAVNPTGGINVIGDSVPQGQGHKTALAQIVSDKLGVDPYDIVVQLDTDTSKDGWSIAAGNYSCRFSPASASACDQAAEQIRDKMAILASGMLNVPAENVEFADSKIFDRNNPDNAVPFYRVGGLAHWSPSSLPEGMDPGLRETAMWSAPTLTPTSAKDEINTSLAYGFGFDFCGVEVDPDTGVVRVDKYVSAHDCGTIINPGLAEGQMRGSWVAGWGAAFLEEFKYDENGSFQSGTFADYLIATAPEVPEFTLVHPTPHASPYTRLGAKGIAEGNQYTTPPCIGNAIADALGYEDIYLPATPSRVMEWLGTEERKPSGNANASIIDEADENRKPGIEGVGEVEVPATPEEVWNVILDPEQMSRIIPGCDRLDVVAENVFKGDIMLGVGPVKGMFEADLRLTDLEKPHRANLVGSTNGPLGSSQGVGAFTLEATENGTLVKYRYEFEISGKVAAVGGRLVAGATRQLIDLFMRSLIKLVSADKPQKGIWSKLKTSIAKSSDKLS